MKHFALLGILTLSLSLVAIYDPVFAEHMGSHHDEPMGQHGMKSDAMGHHHMSYKGMCAPGFAPLNEMCVLDDRCGPGAYAGKVCIMDGVVKQYLKPLHQKHAGLSVGNIICAEGKQVMFKHHNASPACMNSGSVEKLKHRGWQTTLPNLPCTLEHMPVCGIDGISYGNMCALHANHMAMKHDGQCMEPSVKATALYVDSKLSDCVGVAPQQCMLIREDLDSEWNLFYDSIEGFEYQEGTEYKISVSITDVENPPADASSLKYTLVEILESSTTDNHMTDEKQLQGEGGVFEQTFEFTVQPAVVEDEKGYFVTEIANGVYWLTGSGYHTMFLTTGEGVVAFDAPKPIGDKYLDAINEVTEEQITHMVYSHHHQDHTGAAGQIFGEDIVYISHKDAADALIIDDDPNRPVPTEILEGKNNTIQIGTQTIEFHNIGDFHSKGNWLILLPQHKVAMLVDLLRPAESPYRAFGVTPDIELYLETHDVLQTFDFDVLLTGHTNLLATKDHVKTNKEFTQSIMENAQTALDSGEPNPYEACSSTTIDQWTGKLGNLDAFMVDHCTAMIEHLQSK